MNFPIITDPQFYAVAVPAVLLLGVSKSGFGAGFGSLAVPFMALVVTVPQAAAILMPVLLLMDLLGLAAFRRDFDPQLLTRDSANWSVLARLELCTRFRLDSRVPWTESPRFNSTSM